MELQSELSEKHNKDKQQWQKKEVELQNIVSRILIHLNHVRHTLSFLKWVFSQFSGVKILLLDFLLIQDSSNENRDGQETGTS